MLIQFLNALQERNYELAKTIALQILEMDEEYKPARDFLIFYEKLKERGDGEGSSEESEEGEEEDSGEEESDDSEEEGLEEDSTKED